jgi:hypothetical protein
VTFFPTRYITFWLFQNVASFKIEVSLLFLYHRRCLSKWWKDYVAEPGFEMNGSGKKVRTILRQSLYIFCAVSGTFSLDGTLFFFDSETYKKKFRSPNNSMQPYNTTKRQQHSRHWKIVYHWYTIISLYHFFEDSDIFISFFNGWYNCDIISNFWPSRLFISFQYHFEFLAQFQISAP